MKKKLFDIIKFYNIIPLLALATVLIFSRNYIFLLTCNFLKITETSIFYTVYHFTINLALIALWIYITLFHIRNRRYNKITGRNFKSDSRKYHLTYTQLRDYFKIENADPHKLDTSSFPEIDWKNASGIIFGKDKKKLIYIPANCESNIAIMGPPGSGKTAGFANVNALSFPGSVMAIDIKQDIYEYCKNKRKIIRFCPDSATALKDSYHFNPLANINTMSDTEKKLYINSMATTLIPNENNSSDGNYFTTRGRKFFEGIVHLLLFKNPDITFPDIVHKILSRNAFDWVTEAMESDCTEAMELLSSFYMNSEKNISGAYDNLCTALNFFSNPILDELLTDNGKCIDIFLLEQGFDIYLQISQENLNSYASLFTLIISSFCTSFTKRTDNVICRKNGTKNREILLLIDEFPALTFAYSQINMILSTLRSKSVICCIIQQNLNQLIYRYQQAGANSLLSNCNYQVILGSNDITSSKTYSELFGTKKTLKVTNSETSSKNNTSGSSVQPDREPVLRPEDFGDLQSENKMAIYFKGKYCICDKINCYKN